MSFVLSLIFIITTAVYGAVITICSIRLSRKYKQQQQKLENCNTLLQRDTLVQRISETQSTLTPLKFSYRTSIPADELMSVPRDVIMKTEYRKLSDELGTQILDKICQGDISKVLAQRDYPVDLLYQEYRADITLYINPEDF